MGKRGKRMTRAEKVAQSKAAGNPPVTEAVEEARDTALLAEALAENARLVAEAEKLRAEKAEIVKLSRESHTQLADQCADQHEVIQDLREELAELKRQAKARPFPTAPSGDKQEFSLRGQTVSCPKGIGVVTHDSTKESWVVVLVGGYLLKYGYNQIGLDIDEVNRALGVG